MSRRVGSSSARICIARIFGAPETVPAGKHGDERIEVVAILGEPAVDGRDEVHDVRVALERHVLRHAHRAELADAAEIVAAEVDEHHVLGAFLLVALQLLGQPQVLLLVAAARPRAGDRMRLDAPAFDAHQHLRRRSDDRETAHPDEIHVGRRIDVAQRAIDGERIGGDVGLEPLRQHRLIDVAGGDVLLDRPDARFEGLARHVRSRPPAAAAVAAAGCDRPRSSSRSRNWIFAQAN